jgi:hypothetical protein
MADVKDIESILPARAKKDRRKIKHSTVFYFVTRGPIIQCIREENYTIGLGSQRF